MRAIIGPINAATPTPLRSDGTFDHVSARRLCCRWVTAQLDGVLILGSMGEGLLLPERIRTAFVEMALEESGAHVTLFVSAADRSHTEMCERARRYAKMGAPYIVLAAPVGATSKEAVRHVMHVADACPAPCAYYEVPPVTGVALNAREIKEVLGHPNIRAFKDSSNNSLLAQILTSPEFREPGVALLDGIEYRVCYSVATGYDGVLHGGGVMTGRRVRAIWNRAKAGDLEAAIQLDRQNSLCLAEIYNRLSGPVQNISGQKYALKLLGLLSDECALVDQPLDGAAYSRIARVVEAHREWLL